MNIITPCGTQFVIDDEAFDEVLTVYFGDGASWSGKPSSVSWYANNNKPWLSYAESRVRVDGKRRTISLHRLIVGAGPGDVVDHKDGDTRNNQRGNLRIVDHATNLRSHRSDDRGDMRGVYPNGNRWQARITINYKRHNIGSFATPLEAAQARRAYIERRIDAAGNTV